jgi:hypothetical protein
MPLVGYTAWQTEITDALHGDVLSDLQTGKPEIWNKSAHVRHSKILTSKVILYSACNSQSVLTDNFAMHMPLMTIFTNYLIYKKIVKSVSPN